MTSGHRVFREVSIECEEEMLTFSSLPIYSPFFSFRAFTLNQIGVPAKPKVSRI
jgi:hypothetical protein